MPSGCHALGTLVAVPAALRLAAVVTAPSGMRASYCTDSIHVQLVEFTGANGPGVGDGPGAGPLQPGTPHMGPWLSIQRLSSFRQCVLAHLLSQGPMSAAGDRAW